MLITQFKRFKWLIPSSSTIKGAELHRELHLLKKSTTAKIINALNVLAKAN
jgi:hypothetical protein